MTQALLYVELSFASVYLGYFLNTVRGSPSLLTLIIL